MKSNCSFRHENFKLPRTSSQRYFISFEAIVLLISITVTECETIECDSKVFVVRSVDTRVHGRIEPSEPHKKLLQNFISPNAVFGEERLSDIMYEEREPRSNKSYHDDAEK